MSTISDSMRVSVTSMISSINASHISVISPSDHPSSNNHKQKRQGLAGGDDTCGERFTNNNSKNLLLLLIWRKRIVGKNPSFNTQQGRNGSLFDVREFFVEFLGQMETDDW